MKTALMMEWLRDGVADVLGTTPESLATDVPLQEQGLDSIRLMALVERWRPRVGWLTFADLAERPTLADWADLIASRA